MEQRTSVSATTRGEWPGEDFREVARMVLGELQYPHLPAFPQLPQRGPGSAALGRTATMLVGLSVDLQPYGWRLSSTPDRAASRASALMASDIQALADIVGDDQASIPELGIRLTGPLTLAAGLHLPLGRQVLTDRGAVADLAGSLQAGLQEHFAALRSILPYTRFIVVIDELEIQRIVTGSIPSISGYGCVPALERSTVSEIWRSLALTIQATDAVTEIFWNTAGELIDAVEETACTGLLMQEGPMKADHWEQLAAWVATGRTLVLGIRVRENPAAQARAIDQWRQQLGLTSMASLRLCEAQGFAGLTLAQGRERLGALKNVVQALHERTTS